MTKEPIAHLVWLQGRRAADDVEDYYEVARPGDKSVDGSDPFPVYGASPSDAERHARAVPDGWQLAPKEPTEAMKDAYFEAQESRFSALKPDEVYCAMLSAAPSPPAAVQEPVAVNALEWVEASSGYWKAHSVGGRYSTYRVSHALGFDLRRDGESIGEYHLSLEAAKAAAQADYEQRIRSALSTSQSDPAPEIAALPQDVINLVIVAREAFDTGGLPVEEERNLDKALEAFSSRVPYENEPDDASEQEETK